MPVEEQTVSPTTLTNNDMSHLTAKSATPEEVSRISRFHPAPNVYYRLKSSALGSRIPIENSQLAQMIRRKTATQLRSKSKSPEQASYSRMMVARRNNSCLNDSSRLQHSNVDYTTPASQTNTKSYDNNQQQYGFHNDAFNSSKRSILGVTLMDIASFIPSQRRTPLNVNMRDILNSPTNKLVANLRNSDNNKTDKSNQLPNANDKPKRTIKNRMRSSVCQDVPRPLLTLPPCVDRSPFRSQSLEQKSTYGSSGVDKTSLIQQWLDDSKRAQHSRGYGEMITPDPDLLSVTHSEQGDEENKFDFQT